MLYNRRHLAVEHAVRLLLPLCLLLVLSVSGWAHAQDIPLRSDHPQSYEVVPGDTLWDISIRFLQNPWQWPEIWQANPQIANPHLIYPGDIIRLVYVDGRPRLMVDNGAGTPPPPPARRAPVATGDGTLPRVRMSPRIRRQDREDAVPTIALDDIRNFLSDTVVLAAQALKGVPYVLASSGDRARFISSMDKFYVRGQLDADAPVYGIYRRGRSYHDIRDDSRLPGKLLGVQMRRIGSARLDSQNPQTSLMTLLDTSEEVRMDDLVLPMQDLQLQASYMPTAAPSHIIGKIIALESGLAHELKYGVVALNRGAVHGIRRGHVLAAMRPEGTVRLRSGRNIALPDQQVGLVMVFRVFERMSYAMVMETGTGIKKGDQTISPK